jgi:quinol monooxygenase YgiN
VETHETDATCCPIVELRQYTLHPGKRDVLIDLFDREFVESQEAVGMRLIGQFRDLDDPNRFVWLRGFRDMRTRDEGLRAFYGGPVWKAHREAANATMVDSSNVLLLRPARPASGFALGEGDRPGQSAVEVPEALVIAAICYLDAPAAADFIDFFERSLCPALADAGAPILAYFVTDSSENTFPALPVREGENAFAWFSRFRDRAAYERYLEALAVSQAWGELWQALTRRLIGPPEILKLHPTARSRLA